MLSVIRITETGAFPAAVKRHHARVMKQALMETAANHHQRFMPKHFTLAGAREYGYTPRSGEQVGLSRKQFFRSYTGQKQREKGHRRPLVWSGASETLAKIRDVRGTSRRVRLVQHARGLNRKHPRSKIDMAAEIRAVSSVEKVAAVEFCGGRYATHLAAIRDRKTTTI